MIVAEGVSGTSNKTGTRRLQWGRNMIVAEGLLIVGTVKQLKRRLQWGRNMIVAEGAPADIATRPTARLQWGRNMIVAEGGSSAGA